MYNNKEINELIENLLTDYEINKNISSKTKLMVFFGFNGFEEEPTRFFGKYLKLLKYGRVNIKDNKIREFISLFVEDEDVRQLILNDYQTSYSKKCIEKIVNEMNNTLKLDEDELLTELTITFMEIIEDYEVGSYNFNSVLNEQFNKYLFKNIHNAIGNIPFSIVPYEDNIDADAFKSVNHNNDLNLDWVNGIGSSKLFNNFSINERFILKAFYQDKKSISYIARKLKINEKEVVHLKKEIVKKLQQNLKEDRSDE